MSTEQPDSGLAMRRQLLLLGAAGAALSRPYRAFGQPVGDQQKNVQPEISEAAGVEKVQGEVAYAQTALEIVVSAPLSEHINSTEAAKIQIVTRNTIVYVVNNSGPNAGSNYLLPSQVYIHDLIQQFELPLVPNVPLKPLPDVKLKPEKRVKSLALVLLKIAFETLTTDIEFDEICKFLTEDRQIAQQLGELADAVRNKNAYLTSLRVHFESVVQRASLRSRTMLEAA